MAGIYLHIPFCKSRCSYCDFYSNTDESQIDTFVESLCAEARLRKGEVTESIQTVYFGGGTPSRMQQKHFEQIFSTLFETFSIDADVEITLEANPDDLSVEYIRMLSNLPFNRLSIGIQSFHDDELQFLNRRHSALQAIATVKNAQKAGFDNISIDLMYGLPNQTLVGWEKNLQQAIDSGIQHISAYHLIYEEDTQMHSLLQAEKINPASEQLSTDMFSSLINRLTANGFIHYEISNFALPDRYSQHNSSYWCGTAYIGLGAAAHSFDGDNRSWNVSSLSHYMKGIKSGKLNRTIEQLSIFEKYNEFILTGLRTMRGVDLQRLQHLFGEKLYAFCIENARKYLDNGLLRIKEDRLLLSRNGIFVSDGIMSDLMWI